MKVTVTLDLDTPADRSFIMSRCLLAEHNGKITTREGIKKDEDYRPVEKYKEKRVPGED